MRPRLRIIRLAIWGQTYEQAFEKNCNVLDRIPWWKFLMFFFLIVLCKQQVFKLPIYLHAASAWVNDFGPRALCTNALEPDCCWPAPNVSFPFLSFSCDPNF